MKPHRRGLARKMFVPAAALALAVLFAAGCSSGGGDDAAVPAPTAAPSTTEGGVVAATVVTLPEQIADGVAVAPAGVFVSVEDDEPEPEPEGDVGGDGGGGGVVITAPPGFDDPPETDTTEAPAQPVLRPVEFRTTGAGGIQFYVRLGATHPLTECLSYVDGNPALSRLQAATAEAAKTEIATIGQNCLGNPQAISDTADPDAAAVGCVDNDSNRIVNCPTVGTPETPAVQTPAAQEFPVTLQGCPPGQNCADLIPPPPTRRQPTPGLKLSPQGMRNTPGILYGLYPNPYLEGEVGTAENQQQIRTAQYGALNQLMSGNYENRVYAEARVAAGLPRYELGAPLTQEWIDSQDLSSDVASILTWGSQRSDIRPEHTDIGWQVLSDLVSDYETAMGYNGYSIYNTCQSPDGTRFPQLTPDSAMLDFMHRDSGWQTQANGLPPQGLPLEWYFQQAAQAAHDSRYITWHNSWHREPQMLLCTPLINARELELQPSAHNIWMPSSYDPLRMEMTAPQNWDYHVMAIAADRSVVVLAQCYTGADRELIYGDAKDFNLVLIFEDGHYKQGSRLGPDSGNFQTCEEAASLIDASSGTPEHLEDFLSGGTFAFTGGATFETFIYGDYQYPGDGLSSHFGN